MRWTKKATVTAVVVAAAAVGIPLAVVELNQRDPERTAAPVTPGSAPASAVPSEAAATPWVGTWGVALHRGDESFERQTLRQIVRTSIGGQAVRVRLSNEFGEQPLTVE